MNNSRNFWFPDAQHQGTKNPLVWSLDVDTREIIKDKYSKGNKNKYASYYVIRVRANSTMGLAQGAKGGVTCLTKQKLLIGMIFA